eukprot:931627-Pyramimonas_sp.AAC.2
MDLSPGRQTMRGTHIGHCFDETWGSPPSLTGVLAGTVFHPSRTVLYTYATFSVSKCRGPRASTPTTPTTQPLTLPLRPPLGPGTHPAVRKCCVRLSLRLADEGARAVQA